MLRLNHILPLSLRPLILAGYIEHLGTGTTDMIAACEQYGLQTPEFHQAEDFRTIIYRKEKVSNPTQKVSNLDEKVTNLDEKVTNLGEKVTNPGEKSNKARLTAKQRKVLEFCNEMPRTAREIIEMLGVKNQSKTRQQYTTKLVLMGVLRPTSTISNDPNRKYITVHAN